MTRCIAAAATVVLMAAATTRPASAQIDWRDYLSDLYKLKYAVGACDIKASATDLRRLDRTIARGESEVPMRRAELIEYRRRIEAEAARDHQRTCTLMRRDASRLLRDIPGELAD
jgi:hypothetical protein